MFDILELVKSRNNFEKFNPMQEKAIKAGIFEKSVVISSPTASGKTTIAELVALNSILKKGKKVVYTCPLRALASEHAKDFREKYKDLKIKFALSIGDFDSSGSKLAFKDMIFTTYEKLDSLLNHEANWLSNIGVLIVDEIHMLGSDRGPTLEVIITKLKLLNKKIQVLGLSATIPNSKEIADWLSAELVVSNYRPVELKEGIYLEGVIYFKDNIEKVSLREDALSSLALDTLKKNKQAIFFLNTRKTSENYAEKLASISQNYLSEKEKKVLEKASQIVLNVLEQPTKQCQKLASLIKKGSCFHNAGLLHKQRQIIESLFKKNYLKFISSTPTLAIGVNLPAFRVIMPSPYRYSSFGMEKIPVYEWKQVAGRAGRPKYDSSGEAILIAKNESQKQDYFDYFIFGEIEEITSFLNNEQEISFHLLSTISSGFISDMESAEEFFSLTFFANQNKGISKISKSIIKALKSLIEMGFLVGDDQRLEATPLGKRVAQLYLYPLSAHKLIQMLKAQKTNLFSYLFIIASLDEFRPWPKPSKDAISFLQNSFIEKDLPVNYNQEIFLDEHFFEKIHATNMLMDWVSEVKEQNIVSTYNIQPGTFRMKLQDADWLCYSAFELSKLLGLQMHLPNLAILRKRLAYGISEELIELCELKGVGRVRARKLFNSGLKSISSLKNVDVKDLERVLGKNLAQSIKEQLGQAKN
ncbi:MAG: DEAD/DEAH box helicase [Candidatus Diapherotrites archaeon]